MTLHTATKDAPDAARSEHSLAFEAMWRSLPRTGLVPSRSAFQPRLASKFLSNLVLVEVTLGESPALHIRVAGSAFEARLQCSMKGQDYLPYYPTEQRAGTMDVVETMLARPCGRWQLNPLHYECGYAHHIEVTSFPLDAGPDAKPCMIFFTLPVPQPVLPRTTDGNVIAIHRSVAYKYIDIGAGVPS
jgi:hypothetical protein